KAGRGTALSRKCQFRPAAFLNFKAAWGDHAGEFSVPELLQKSENVSVDGLLPDAVAVGEVPADAHSADAGVEGTRVEGEHAAFAVAKHADLRRLLARVLREPIDRGEDLLHLVADQVPAQLEGRAVEVLAVGQIRPAHPLFHLAADERRHDDAAAALGQPAGE